MKTAAPAVDDGTFDRQCRRAARIIAFLESYQGERLTTVQICEGLRIDPGPFGEPSPDHVTLICALCKLLEYRKISHDRVECESVWWIEPKYATEPEPEFNLRHVKAVARSKDF